MKPTESDLINELFRSVESLGVDGTTSVLKLARNNVLTLQDKRIEFVLKMCSLHYLQNIQDIIYSHNKSIKRMMALKFSVYYLYEVFNLSYTDLKLIFKRDKSMLCRSVKEIKNLCESDNAVKEIKKKFDLLISDFKLQNQL